VKEEEETAAGKVPDVLPLIKRSHAENSELLRGTDTAGPG
jgi:hypothetical protein